ncbi:MAG: 2-phospho-L-lactate guanylyltransferase [Candidatus Dormibacterales bacterium]
MPAGVWAVVLVKSFDSAKQRLGGALDGASRERLARANAGRALAAAAAADHVLAVAGGTEAARLARLAGAEVLLEASPAGQNQAAAAGVEHALRRGAGAVLLLSSDLPLVTRRHVARMLAAARGRPAPLAVAAPAAGRGGTNALYLEPPGALSMHFGEDSLAAFSREARANGVTWLLHRSAALALDLDEPQDLEALRVAAPSA